MNVYILKSYYIFFMMKRIKQQNKHYFEYMQRHFLRYWIHFCLGCILKITTNLLHDAHDCTILCYIISVKFFYTVSSSSVWLFPTEYATHWTQRNLMLHPLSFLIDMFPHLSPFFLLNYFYEIPWLDFIVYAIFFHFNTH